MLSRIRNVFIFVLPLTAAILNGCLPTSTAKIAFESGIDLGALGALERVVENAGFHRIWFEPKEGARSDRLHRDGALLSWFESNAPGYMIRVSRQDAAGVTKIFFTEF